MRGTRSLGVGLIVIGAAGGCGGDDTAPGSKVGQAKGGSSSGGSGGAAGSLSLSGLPNGGAGSGGGGAGGANAAGQAGSSTGGVVSQAGSSNGGTGGTKPVGMCKRSAGSDADCLDFYPAEPPDPAKAQAFACDDTGAYLTSPVRGAPICRSGSIFADS